MINSLFDCDYSYGLHAGEDSKDLPVLLTADTPRHLAPRKLKNIQLSSSFSTIFYDMEAFVLPLCDFYITGTKTVILHAVFSPL